LVALVAGLVGPAGSVAASKKHDPGTCVLSKSATGDLLVTGSGFTPSSSDQYEIYSAPGASVGGGQLSSDASGSFSADLGPTSFFMSVYPNETTLTLDLYPIIGNKANMSTVLGSCSITP
jgi:hypothetical protein